MEIRFIQVATCVEEEMQDPGVMIWSNPKFIPRVGEIVYIRGKNDVPREVTSVIYVGSDEAWAPHITITCKKLYSDNHKEYSAHHALIRM